jgi:hypothetical protein
MVGVAVRDWWWKFKLESLAVGVVVVGNWSDCCLVQVGAY